MKAIAGGRTAGLSMIAGIFAAVLAEAVAGTALALAQGDIIGDIHVTSDEYAWLDIGYVSFKLIGFAAAPWLLSRVAPLTSLLWATLILGATCALAACVVRLDTLVILRTVQGFAGAVLLVSGQAMLFWYWPKPAQPLLQAVFAIAAVVAPATIAPVMQGWLLDTQSWTWIFIGAVPLSLGGAGLILLSDQKSSAPLAPRRLDWPGLMLLGIAVTCLTYVLHEGSRWDWFEEDHIVWTMTVAALAFLLMAARHRYANAGSLFDLSVFRVDDFAFAFVISFLAGAVLFGSVFLIPAFAVAILGFTPTAAGLLLLPSAFFFMLALLLAAWLVQVCHVPPIATVPFGILLTMAAMYMLSRSNGDSGAGDMMLALLLRGLGLGFLFLSITLIALNGLSKAQLAFGIGIFNIGRQLGGLMGVAGLQTLIAHEATAARMVLNAALNPGAPRLAERLASLTSFLVGKGMDPETAARLAFSLLNGATTRQSLLIAFDAAFLHLAALFVVAVPVVVLCKFLFFRGKRDRSVSRDSA